MTKIITNEWLVKYQITEMIEESVLSDLDAIKCTFTQEFQNEVFFESTIQITDVLITKRYKLNNYSSYEDLPEDLSDVDWDASTIEYKIESI